MIGQCNSKTQRLDTPDHFGDSQRSETSRVLKVATPNYDKNVICVTDDPSSLRSIRRGLQHYA